MNRVSIFLVPAAAVLMVAVAGCSEKDDNNGEALALLALASGNQKEQASHSLAAANAAQSATSSSQAQSDLTAYGIPQPNQMLANMVVKDPGIMTTALSKSGGTCSYSGGNWNCDVTINGTSSCPLGGTAQFDNFSLEYSGNYGTGSGLTMTLNGPVTYSNCRVSYYDYTNNGVATTAVLDGSAEIDFSGTSKFEITGSNTVGTETTTSADIISQSTNVVTSNGLIVDGNAVSFSSVTVSQDLTGSLTISTDTATGTTSSTSTMNGSISVNGSPVVTFDGETVTVTCTSTGGEFSCTQS